MRREDRVLPREEDLPPVLGRGGEDELGRVCPRLVHDMRGATLAAEKVEQQVAARRRGRVRVHHERHRDLPTPAAARW